MAEIAKLKKQKNAYKLHLTVSINKLTSELNKEEKDRNVELLQQYIQQVEFKHEKWEKAMMEIQDQDENCDIDESMEKIDSTLDEVISLKVRTKECIESKVKVEKVDNHDRGTPEQPRKLQDKVHLPKLELKKFNGINIECFQEWYQIFIATIGKSNLDDVEKFVYLKGAVEEDAEKVIEGYPLTRENYELALGDLYDTYGDKEVVINHHVSKLLSLPNQADTSLRELYTKIVSHVRSLEALGITAQSYSVFLVPIVKSKLNEDLRKELTKNKIKDIKALLLQLKEEVATEASSAQVKLAFEPDVPATLQKPQSKVNKPNYNWANNQQSYQPVYSSAQALQATANTRAKYCIFCPGMQSHWVEDCKRLATLPPNQVKDIAMNSNACLGCFKKGHYFRECRARERLKCEKCQSPGHHTALHEDRTSGAYLHEDRKKNTYVTITAGQKEESSASGTESVVNEKSAENSGENSVSDENAAVSDVNVKGATSLQARLGKESTIMPIIRVRLEGNNGKKLEVNAMFDQCSDQTFIRSDVTKALALDGPTIPIEVAGITGITNGRKDRKLISTSLFSKDFSQEVKVSLVEMPVICKPILRPAVSPEVLNSRNLRNLNLADDYLNEEEKEIHLLIGLDHYYSCITGRIKRNQNQPVAIETIFGWMLVSDSLNQELQQRSQSNTMCTMFISEEAEKGINDDLKKFWELEEEIIAKPVKPEHEAAVKKFHESVTYDRTTKKYEVGLPYIDDKDVYSNYKKSEIMLKSQLNRFEKNPNLKEKYQKAMNEYIDQGFAELVPDDEIHTKDPGVYYMPHSAVIKDENTSTKTRIVFNASSSTKHHASLNDKLLKGPKRQPSITEILIRWRINPIAFVADIRKMYSMILVREEDRNALRFLWVNENGDIKHYRHKVLPFGVRSAPYLAIETVHSHIMKFSEEFPEVTESLVDSTYVDDFCSAEASVMEAISTITASGHIMDEAGMQLTKWKSNDPEVMKFLKEMDPATDVDTDGRKVLGAWWNAVKDVFYYIVNPTIYTPQSHITKRMIVGSAPKLHDPIGFIAPVVVKAKMMIQKLWSSGVEWDENIAGTDIAKDWLEWRNDLKNLSKVELNRKYTPVGIVVKNQQVHIFCDASEDAYATVAYLRTEAEDGKVYVGFITAKTKVAPLKFVTLPRKELLSALIASRMSIKIKAALNDPKLKFVHWSDSEITLHWIKNTDTQWKQFVESRADESRDNADPSTWRHCPGKQNPADIASRGSTVTALIESSLWGGGPGWLYETEEHWPQKMHSLVPTKDALKEKRNKQSSCLVTTSLSKEYEINPLKYSRFNTLLMKTAYLRRFPNNCRLQMMKKPMPLKEITAEEMTAAENYWLRFVQDEYYSDELTKLKAGNPVKKDSKIIQLSPFLDESGLIRMQGRLQEAVMLSEDEKHPIILPHQSYIVRLIVEEIHRIEMHTGINGTLVALRYRFWVTHGRSLVKTIVKGCLICRKHMPQRLSAPLAPLPADRITRAAPFEVIGIDFTGPVYISETKQTMKCTKKRPVQLVKTKTISKAYIALTTCAVTRAVHVELVPDLTTDAFMRSFRRFVSRRGQPSVIYSDNAKTYQSAEKGIVQCYEIMNSPPFKAYLAEKSIQWKFICPLSPWWGGFWERFMKTIKLPMKKVLGTAFFSADELYTVLTEVEAMANSRPLCAVSDDPDSLEYLTPANFLIGRSTINLPIRPLKHSESHPTATRKELNSMLQKQEKILNRLWKFWTEEYVRGLGVAPAIKDLSSIQQGDLVMVASNIQPRCTWKLGRVAEVREGRDGRIRSAVIQRDGKLYTRPIQLLSKLEVTDPEDPAHL